MPDTQPTAEQPKKKRSVTKPIYLVCEAKMMQPVIARQHSPGETKDLTRHDPNDAIGCFVPVRDAEGKRLTFDGSTEAEAWIAENAEEGKTYHATAIRPARQVKVETVTKRTLV